MTNKTRWEAVEVEGIKFYRVLASDIYLNGIFPDEIKSDDYILVFANNISTSKDNYLDFPSKGELKSFGPWYRSGIAQHISSNEQLYSTYEADQERKLDAKEVEVFDEMYFHKECMEVLKAHGWLIGIDAPQWLTAKVLEKDSKLNVEYLESRYGDNWQIFIQERAAYYFTEPLSRLWYAANMMALYYIYHDDMRVGYFWSEYCQRMLSESSVERSEKIMAAAKLGGEARQSSTSDRSSLIVSHMQNLTENGHSVSRAATLAANDGIGTSADANRKLFYRKKVTG